MTEDLQNPITNLLIKLANSLHERYPESAITFNDSEFEIVRDWMVRFAQSPQTQMQFAKIFFNEK